jgi:putative PIN family toxin of toxin-antitoxin system
MPSAVFDTMINVRALLTARGVTGRLLKALMEDAFELVTSEPLLEELRRTLAYPKVQRLAPHRPLSPDAIEEDVKALKGVARQIVPGAYVVEMVAGDPKDNPVVAAALEGGAGYIVTDDRVLLTMKVVLVAGYDPIQVVSASAFLRLLGRR